MPFEADLAIANAQLRLTLLAMVQVLGDKSFDEIADKANLQFRSDKFPDDNFLPSITAADYAKLMEVVEETYNRSGSRILQRIGRAYFLAILRERPALFNIARTALGFWSEDQRVRFVLESLVDMINGLNPQNDLRFEQELQKYIVIDHNCSNCYQRTSVEPVCHFMLGMIEQAVEWGRLKNFEISEIDCIAMGKNYCRFLISR
jgi:predicted hydrocarbon binding protein